jgi:hypothetical protein
MINLFSSFAKDSSEGKKIVRSKLTEFCIGFTGSSILLYSNYLSKAKECLLIVQYIKDESEIYGKYIRPTFYAY